MGMVSDVVKGQSRLGTGMGFVLVVIGMLAIMAPFVSGVATTALVGILMIAGGMTITAYCFKAGSFGKGLLQFLFGGITVLAGVAMLLMPVVSMFTLTGVLLAYFIADGIVTIYSGFKSKPQPGWGWIVASGIASIVLGGLLWYGWPDTGRYAVGLLVGIRLLFAGWTIAMLGMTGDAVGDTIEQAGKDIRREVTSEMAKEVLDAEKDIKQEADKAPEAQEAPKTEDSGEQEKKPDAS